MGSASSTPWRLRLKAPGYWSRTRDPLPNLLFLLPFVLVYETAMRLAVQPTPPPPQPLVAQRILDILASWLGVVGSWVAPAALVGTLLVWHLARRQPWRVPAAVPGLMLLESAALTVPLVVLNAVLLLARTGASLPHAAALAFGLGAGIYEEFVFRLCLIAALAFVLRTAHTPSLWVGPLAVVLAAIVFAAFHVSPLGAEAFDGARFLARWAAGCYLGLVYRARGIGIAAGAHACYNVLMILVRP